MIGKCWHALDICWGAEEVPSWATRVAHFERKEIERTALGMTQIRDTIANDCALWLLSKELSCNASTALVLQRSFQNPYQVSRIVQREGFTQIVVVSTIFCIFNLQLPKHATC